MNVSENVVIRFAEPKDYEVIGRLLAGQLKMHRAGRPDLFKNSSGKYSFEDFCGLLDDPEAVVFTALCGEEVAGYLICVIQSKKGSPILQEITTLYLDDLCVAPEYRGRGIGRKLMIAAEEHAKKIGCHNVTLNVWGFNDGAKAFYDKMGYTPQRILMEKVIGEE